MKERSPNLLMAYAMTCHFFNTSYEVFAGRSLLAVLDHNFHLFREVTQRYHKLYSKRSGNWRVEPIKVSKDYKHLDVMLVDIFKRRAEDEEPITRKTEVSPSNPRNLAKTIALKDSPLTSDLVQNRISRIKDMS